MAIYVQFSTQRDGDITRNATAGLPYSHHLWVTSLAHFRGDRSGKASYPFEGYGLNTATGIAPTNL